MAKSSQKKTKSGFASLRETLFSGNSMFKKLFEFFDYVFLFCSFHLFYAITIILLLNFLTSTSRSFPDYSVFIFGAILYGVSWYLKKYSERKATSKKFRSTLERRITRLIEESLYISFAVSLSLFIHLLFFPDFNELLISSISSFFPQITEIFLYILLLISFVLVGLAIFVGVSLIAYFALVYLVKNIKPEAIHNPDFLRIWFWFPPIMGLIALAIVLAFTGGYVSIEGVNIPQLWEWVEGSRKYRIGFVYPATFDAVMFSQRVTFYVIGPLAIYLVRMLFFREHLNMDKWDQ